MLRLRRFFMIFTLALALVWALGGWVFSQEGSDHEPQPVSFIYWSHLRWSPATSQALWEEAYKEGKEGELAPVIILGGGMVEGSSLELPRLEERLTQFIDKYIDPLVIEEIPLLLALGPEDFGSERSSAPKVMEPILSNWREALGEGYYLDDLGNGTYPHKLGSLKVLSLNSLLMAHDNTYSPRALKEQRQRTWEWLEGELKGLGPQETAFLLSSLPPLEWTLEGEKLWDRGAWKDLAQILARYPGKVSILAGGTEGASKHALYLDEGRSVPLLVAGSLATREGRQANYRLYQVEFYPEDGEPSTISWEVRYLGPGLEKYLDYCDNPLYTSSWEDLSERLQSDDKLYEAYLRDYEEGQPSATQLHDRELRQRLSDDLWAYPLEVEEEAEPQVEAESQTDDETQEESEVSEPPLEEEPSLPQEFPSVEDLRDTAEQLLELILRRL